jgi:hypothetical protein
MALAGGDYEIRIKGRLSDSLLVAFEGLRPPCSRWRRCCTARSPDQAALYRLLDRIQSLGLELVEIRQLPLAWGVNSTVIACSPRRSSCLARWMRARWWASVRVAAAAGGSTAPPPRPPTAWRDHSQQSGCRPGWLATR